MVPEEQLQYDFDSAIKCKTSGTISKYEVISKYGDCDYYLKIFFENNYYFTNVFHNEKNCSEENSKKLINKTYPKGKKLEVVVNAEQNYIFLADKNTKDIKYDSDNIGNCNQNFILQKKEQNYKSSLDVVNYNIYGAIIIIFLIIVIFTFKLKQKSNS